MAQHLPVANRAEIQPLLEMTERVGGDPLLTQASTGNSSLKMSGVLWIKTSGKWMMDALRDDIFTAVDLAQVRDCVRRGLDPAQVFAGASLETAMHASMPHRVVLHVHCVDTISWGVRGDGPKELDRRLSGLRWRWIPYVESGLPLAGEITRAISSLEQADVFVLGNHGLVLGGEDERAVENLLAEVRSRVRVRSRDAHPADYAALSEMSAGSEWELPEDDRLHALGTDSISQTFLAGGLLFPCQAIFTGARTPELFRSIPFPGPGDDWKSCYRKRPFLIFRDRGLLVKRNISPSELGMLSGLTEVVQRLCPPAPMRYLTEFDAARVCAQASGRYLAASCNRRR